MKTVWILTFGDGQEWRFKNKRIAKKFGRKFCDAFAMWPESR